MNKIQYPYLPKGREIKYVSLENEFMLAAKNSLDHKGCVKHPTSAVVVQDGKIVGRGSNAGKWVEICPRWGSPTGTNYGPCKEVCEQEGHAEVVATRDAQRNIGDIAGADLYMYGHWWCCQPCWETMIAAGIKDIYLLDNSWELFNPEINEAMQNWGRPKF